ncbi:metal-dependent hydrolase [Spongiibacter taiwanensis]|uniref:metal-dependent hydrolase n=1 Tax=Spongiibacter taiwanensis TaxID=1748242 RepID=UPI002035AF0E|nr:metal-dependent hydrolase [Spongiibacter taiwanensis]USA43947.1 metal-dependent hydrolase [Spongiibacter taiwanensis]
MDPLTQGLLGVTASQNLASRSAYQRRVAGIGFLAGMAADLDVLIRSPADPLLFLEFHRQFTHSLVFIPLAGALLGTLLYTLFARKKLPLWQCIVLACAGYATHGLLDACTTYGTQLLWPFSSTRIAWNTLSIIDPLYTLPLLALCVLALKPGRRWAARTALAWALIYPGIGWIQRDRAEAAGLQLALSRGHRVDQLEAKPAFANLLLWKTIYRSGETFFVDGIRAGRELRVYPGSSIPRLDIARDLPFLQANSQQAIDLERFRWFSKGYIALDPTNPLRVVDIRYSLLPNEIEALWSIELAPQAPDQHVTFANHRNDARAKSRTLWQMLLGREVVKPQTIALENTAIEHHHIDTSTDSQDHNSP